MYQCSYPFIRPALRYGIYNRWIWSAKSGPFSLFQSSIRSFSSSRKISSSQKPSETAKGSGESEKPVNDDEALMREIARRTGSKSTGLSINDDQQSGSTGYGGPEPFTPFRGTFVFAGLVVTIIAAGLFYKWRDVNDMSLYTLHFRPASLLKLEECYGASSLLTLQMRGTQGNIVPADLWKRAIWSIEVKQPQLQIARHYTPLPLAPHLKSGQLQFLIRKEPGGEVSNYLHNLLPGAKVELRGPHVEYQIPGNLDEVLFIAGGTGIVPAMQVANCFAQRPPQRNGRVPKVTILWANRKAAGAFGSLDQKHIPADLSLASLGEQAKQELKDTPLSQLAAIGHAGTVRNGLRLCANLFVDERSSYIQAGDIQHELSSIDAIDGANEMKTRNKKMIFVSGPEGFVSHVAGPRILHMGVEVQGPVAGLLSAVDLKGWQVWKL
ncbi:MAG: mitochondrial peripheral inner membrane protein [Alyxoria varia]|nr:MAG: mitochondrial peripheral inner membrane protein [Alyxoria varia]